MSESAHCCTYNGVRNPRSAAEESQGCRRTSETLRARAEYRQSDGREKSCGLVLQTDPTDRVPRSRRNARILHATNTREGERPPRRLAPFVRLRQHRRKET